MRLLGGGCRRQTGPLVCAIVIVSLSGRLHPLQLAPAACIFSNVFCNPLVRYALPVGKDAESVLGFGSGYALRDRANDDAHLRMCPSADRE